MSCDEFIKKLKLLPERVKRAKVIRFRKSMLIKTDNIITYLNTVYKLMPDVLRVERSKGMKTSYQSFKHLELLDKLFFGKTFLNKHGYALINETELSKLISSICAVIQNDENKILSLPNS